MAKTTEEKAPEGQQRAGALVEAEVDTVEEEVPFELAMEEKYKDWPDEEVNKALSETRTIFAKANEELSLADAMLQDAATKDAESLSNTDGGFAEGETVQTPNLDKAKRYVENLFLRQWSLEKSGLELDTVMRMRRASACSERMRELAPKIEDQRRKVEEAQRELQGLWSESHAAAQERTRLTEGWKDRRARYEYLLQGPELATLRRFLNSG